MSHTDKDKPLWVQNAEHGVIDHDHTRGVCIVLNDQRDRWGGWRHHFGKRCKKRVLVEFECHPEKVNGKRQLVFPEDIELPQYRYGYSTRLNTDACWVWTCDCPFETSKYGTRIYEDSSWGHRLFCEHRYFVKCRGHSFTETDDSIPCSCDAKPEAATCTPAWGFGRHFFYGGIPSDFVRQHYHCPERARERKLRDMAREYNAYGDIEDDDFENRQARNSMRWVYW